MTELIKHYLPWVLLFVSGWLIIAQPESIFKPEYRVEYITDTTYVDVPYEVQVLKEVEVEVPVKVTIYETVYDTIVDFKVKLDTVYIETSDGVGIIYHPSFLTQYHQHPKLLSGRVSMSNIELTGLFPNGATRTSTYNTRLDRYNYTIGITELGNIAIQRDRISFRERLKQSYFNEAYMGYDFMNNLPTIQYRTGFNTVYMGLGLEGQIEITENVAARVGVNYRF